MVLYSSCVAEFRGNLFSLDFVLLIGLCNLNNLLKRYQSSISAGAHTHVLCQLQHRELVPE